MSFNEEMLSRIRELRVEKKRILHIWLAGLVFLSLLFVCIRILYTYDKELPSLSQLTNIEPSLSAKIYSTDGQLIKQFYYERRILIPLQKMPPQLIAALLATEDRNFFKHWGVNLLSMFRAVWVSFWSGQRVKATSTITQQLARTLFLTPERTIPRKIKEVLTAIKIERNYSKNEILEMYLNQCNFGKGAYGVQAAAQTYFNKNPDELTLSGCALLVGLLQAPGRYSPIERPHLARLRRNIVLDAMADDNKISPTLADSLKKLPLVINPSGNSAGEAPYFTEMVRQYLERRYGEKELYSGGLSVYTTLNSVLQKEAEEILLAQLSTLQQQMEKTHSLRDSSYTLEVADSSTKSRKGTTKRVYKQIQGALVALDNTNGNILAMVGGKDFEKSKFNRAVQAQRQPGSAFKPFVFTAAIDNGYPVTEIIYDTPIVLIGADGKEWRPENFDRTFKGPMNLREALRISRNLVSIKLLQKIGPAQAIFYASKMGIKSKLQPVPSLGIGTSEVNLLELSSAYSVFPNGGIRVEPSYVLRIVDRYGNILEENSSPQKEEVLGDQTAYVMTSLLQTVVNSGTGYGARLLGFDRPAGGKTGTTDECMDNWFIGFTPQITAGVWVGYDDKTVIGEDVTGATTALPIWARFMIKAQQNLPLENFKEPPGIVHTVVCAQSGLLPTDKCPSTTQEVFIAGTQPEEYCNLHPSRGRPSRR